MNEYSIIWSHLAISKIRKMPRPISKAIYKKVDELKKNPYSKNTRKLRGSRFFRLRVGDYRVIFDIEKNNLLILVVNVGPRKRIYKELGRL